MTAVNRIDGMPPSAAPGSFAVELRRESRREEWSAQTKLAEMLDKYLDPADTLWTSLENKPLSRLSGLFQKRRGVRRGLPDELVIWRGKPIFIEIAGRCSDESAETNPRETAAGRRRMVAGEKRPRGADGAAPLRCGLPPSMEAAAAQAMGGTVCGPDAAAAAGAGRGGAAAMAGASAAPRSWHQDCERQVMASDAGSSRPRSSRVIEAVIRDPALTAGGGQLGVIQAVAPSVGVEVTPVNVRDRGEIERAITAFARSPNGGLIVTASTRSPIKFSGLASNATCPDRLASGSTTGNVLLLDGW